MKNIFTMILFAAGTFNLAYAQVHEERITAWNYNKKISYDKHSRFDKGNDHAYHDSYFSLREKQEKLQMINREFDQKVTSVKYDWRISGREKTRLIQWLQRQRKNAISKVEFQDAKSKSFSHDSHKW